VLDAEFSSEEQKARFLGEKSEDTNLSEYAGPGLNKAGQGVSDD